MTERIQKDTKDTEGKTHKALRTDYLLYNTTLIFSIVLWWS